MDIKRRTALQVGLIGAAVGLYNVASGQRAGQAQESEGTQASSPPRRSSDLETASVSADLARRNNILDDLRNKTQVDGPQFVDGSRWMPHDMGSLSEDGGSTINGKDCIWVREYTGVISLSWWSPIADGKHDNYVQLQAWADAGRRAGYGARLYAPPGDYCTSKTVTFQSEYLLLDMQGILRPYGDFSDFLTKIGTEWPNNLQSADTFGRPEWQKRVSIENLTLECRYQSRGLWLTCIDHYELSRIYIRHSLGAAVRFDRVREGDCYGLKAVRCKQGPDLAIVEFYDMGGGDTSNTSSWYGLEIVYCLGRYLYIDSSPKSFATTPSEYHFPPRFLNFYGIHMEDIVENSHGGFDFGTDQAPELYQPNGDVDRLWIRRGRNINFFGGTLNAGKLTTGSIVRLGDLADDKPLWVESVRFIGTNIFYLNSKSTGGTAIKAERVLNLDISLVNWWLTPGTTQVKYATGIDPSREDYQPVRWIGMPDSAMLSMMTGADQLHTPQMVWGRQGDSAIGTIQHHMDQPSRYFTLAPDTSRIDATSFVFPADGHLWGTQPIWLGAADNAAAGGLVLKPWKAAPSGMMLGSIILCDPSDFDPLQRGATADPYLARYTANGWKALS